MIVVWATSPPAMLETCSVEEGTEGTEEGAIAALHHTVTLGRTYWCWQMEDALFLEPVTKVAVDELLPAVGDELLTGACSL